MPTDYQEMEFLRPLLEELRPPLIGYHLQALIGTKRLKQYFIEFDTLADLGLKQEAALSQPVDWYPEIRTLISLKYDYAVVSAFGDDKLVQNIKDAMVNDPTRAHDLLIAVGSLFMPATDMLGSTSNFSLEHLAVLQRILGKRKSAERDRTLYEIGVFILSKMINYPTTMDGCYRIIQEYQDNQLLQVSQALHRGVKESNIDVIKARSGDLSTILDNVWKDAKKVGHRRDFISGGVSTLLGLIGELASAFPGLGVLAALGFQALDRYTGLKLSERLARTISPNYLVTVYDFQGTLSARKTNTKS
jgi:hypothetical protein